MVLQCQPIDLLPDVDISGISDQQLLEHLCQNRAFFSHQRNDDDILLVECFVPLGEVVHPYRFRRRFSQEYAVVCLLADEDSDAPLTMMHMALIRGCLMGADWERLRVACSRPCWTVASDEIYAGHCFTSSGKSSPTPIWRLDTNHSLN